MGTGFQLGDWVWVKELPGNDREIFPSGCEAIVVGVNHGCTEYSLYVEGKGENAWYNGRELTLIETGRQDKLKEWEAADKVEQALKGDLDWIFAHGPEVMSNPHGASIAALARCFGLDNLWGSRGEGFVYYENAWGTLRLAEPFLESGDKVGWQAKCEEWKQKLKEAQR